MHVRKLLCTWQMWQWRAFGSEYPCAVGNQAGSLVHVFQQQGLVLGGHGPRGEVSHVNPLMIGKDCEQPHQQSLGSGHTL